MSLVKKFENFGAQILPKILRDSKKYVSKVKNFENSEGKEQFDGVFG